ncbi:sugar ABC transporter substrate-binding protein [Nocardioides sp.]|uniref:sugar ABC transporter substrate-binding protein n=1 Tax=Nocardioides sp. TaxID=35761 RepID=UPI002609CEE6|nr:sugar ABC transporter substrate-binding protein [Nocardioides sp.]
MRINKIVVAGVAATVLALSACSNQSPSGSSSSNGASTTKTDSSKKLTVAVVTHSAPGDPFWDVVKSGATQAGKDLNITMQYNGDPDPTKQSQLIENAIAQKVDGLVVSMANPDGVKGAVQDAVKAGIPVVTINSGLEESKAFGAITHIGQSEELAGEAAGAKFKELGGKHMICVIHEAGNIGLESRCKGAAKAFGGKVENLQVNISNIANVQATIASKLNSDKSVDAILTLNNAVGTAAVQAEESAKSTAPIGTFDVSSDVTTAIEGGKIAFAIDQQPYVQGYMPLVVIALKDRNGNDVGGGQPVYSGPAFVTKDNVAQVAQFAANGTR